MKQQVIIFILSIFIFSCNKTDEPTDIKSINQLMVDIAIVDAELNDCLDPASPSYWGNEYTKGIEVKYLCNGRKCTFKEYCFFIGVGLGMNNYDNYTFIDTPPVGIDEKYTITCTSRAFYSIGGKFFTTTYICYPDGGEDEIKVQILKYKHMTVIDKLWINDELVSDQGTWNPISGFTGDYYFNPKYYPWIKPRFDDQGNLYGMFPETNYIVLTK